MGGVRVVVFCDLVESTALLARLGDDRMERIRRAHVNDVRAAVDGAGGRLVKTLGDGAMASFESALGALRAAAAIQAAVVRHDRAEGGIGLAARVGIGAGEPIADGDDLHGMAVVIASRLCAAAASGEVLVQDLVAELVASRDGAALDAGREYRLRGVPVPVSAAALRWHELAAAASLDGDGGAATAHDGPPQPGDGDASAPSAPIPLPRMLAAYAREPLIGRDREIAALREASAARAGRHAVLLVGEPGIGKTRHAAAAAAEAHADGAVVVLARCPPEPAVAFEPWVRGIGDLAHAGDDGWRARLAQAAGAELSALVPELAEHAIARAGGGASELVAAEGARYRLLHGIASALATAAVGAPLHVVLDDAHWCDAASAQALAHLLERAPAERLVLVVTARERELERGHPVARVLADLRRTRDLTELRLTGLDADGLAALAAAHVGRAVSPAVAARLRARTAGNPFFAAELARDLDEQGALGDGDALAAAPVPEAVADLVEERLARLSPTAERLLVAAAAIGPSAPVALAAQAADIPAEQTQRAVAEALAERLVDELPAARPAIAFPHALVREARTARAPEADRARLHLAVAQALEADPGAEPAELARHHRLAAPVAGAAPAIAACEAAAAAASAAHDHEQAAEQLRGALALIPPEEPAARAPLLLELGEQELLSADLRRARAAFGAAAGAARATGDAATLARAALGFAGGDIGFGWEGAADHEATVPLLREGLEALGDDDPRLALRMTYRLVWSLAFTDDECVLAGAVRRAQELHERIGDAESELLARFAAIVADCSRGPDPLHVMRYTEDFLRLVPLAERCGREDLLFRVVQIASTVHYALGDMAACEGEIERIAALGERLGSPRFAWEVDLNRAYRLIERGERAAGEALLHRAGATIRRLRPDIHAFAELGSLLALRWFADGDAESLRDAYLAMEQAVPYGVVPPCTAAAAAFAGDREGARRRVGRLLTDDLQPLRRPDIHLPASLAFLALAVTEAGDRAAGERLRGLLEPARGLVIPIWPMTMLGHVAEWHLGRLELLAGRHEAAVEELRTAVAQVDACGLVWLRGWARADLARALHRRGRPGDADAALAALAEAEAIAERHAQRWIARQAAAARAELEGRPPPPAPPAPERVRTLRALTARGGRRALAATVRGLDDAALEQRFLDPRRQRALLRAMARGFQPAHAGGFQGVIAYEIEPFAVDPPRDAPWRWALEVDTRAGRARLREPAPLDAATTIHIGLADFVRAVAGVQHAVAAMAAGRCSVAGDMIVAARVEAMFGGADGA